MEAIYKWTYRPYNAQVTTVLPKKKVMPLTAVLYENHICDVIQVIKNDKSAVV